MNPSQPASQLISHTFVEQLRQLSELPTGLEQTENKCMNNSPATKQRNSMNLITNSTIIDINQIQRRV
jgi:hypothetical protein